LFFFFFQAEDGIRDLIVTGVQTCALPISVHVHQLQVLQLVNVDSGEMLGRDGQAVALAHRDEGNGMVTISASRPPSTKGVDGQEIGRASCRERGEVAVVGGAWKEKEEI